MKRVMVIIKTGILNAFDVLKNLAFDDRLICSGVIMTALILLLLLQLLFLLFFS